MKILLVEDELSTARLLSATLSGERYTVDIARDGQTSIELANQWQYDLILLDIMIPRLDGIVVCQRLRSQGYQMPILLLTAKNSTHDIVRGLDAGADDYLTKPFVFSQLLARIRALLRRGKNPVLSSLLSWGKLTLNPVSLQANYQGREIELKPREYKLLELFLRHPRQVFSRNAIIDRLWTSDNYPTEGAVTNLIKDLRQRLKKVGIVEEVIETVFGIGYRLKPVLDNQLESKQSGIEAIDEAKAWFSSSLKRRIRVLEEVERAMLTNTLTEPQKERAKAEAHKLVGGLGTFGYPEGVALVRQIERLLSYEGKLEPTIVRDFSRELASLKQSLSGDRPKLTATTVGINIDALTKLPNRHAFEYHLKQGCERSKREQIPIAVILCEIDFFQLYNFECGYAVGNTCLQQLAITLQQCIPDSGLAARYGGAEFAIYLPSENLDVVVRLAETIQQQIFELNIPHQSSTLSDRLTMSLGIVGTVSAVDNSVSTLMNTANQALQAAKWRGGNTYCLYSL